MAEYAAHRSPTTHAAARPTQYVVVFGVLGALTLVELGVVLTPGIPKTGVVIALIALAIAKAALIALFYMHLRFETGMLKLTVLGPLVAPAIYGLVLIAEAGVRAVR